VIANNKTLWLNYQIHIIRSNSLNVCTCGGLYYSAEPLPMGFTLPRTRLAHDHLGSLSCQRLGPSTTLTTWINLLYVRLTDSLEFQDATLLESLSNIYTVAPPWGLHKRLMELRLSLTISMFLRPNLHVILKH